MCVGGGLGDGRRKIQENQVQALLVSARVCVCLCVCVCVCVCWGGWHFEEEHEVNGVRITGGTESGCNSATKPRPLDLAPSPWWRRANGRGGVPNIIRGVQRQGVGPGTGFEDPVGRVTPAVHA